MEKYLQIATVLRPQGIRGEIKVKPQTDTPEDVRGFKRIYIEGTEYKVLAVRVNGDFAYLTLSGVADRNAAELLRDKEISALREDAPEPDEGRYYIVDLVGCGVYGGNKFLGTVKDVTPAKTDIYVLETDGKDKAFAAADGVITDVDIENKKITVNKKRFEECSVDY